MTLRYDSRPKSLLDPASQPPLEPSWFRALDSKDALCAELSRLSYIPFEYDPAPLDHALAGLGMTCVQKFWDPLTDTQCFACVDKDQTGFIVFRGTRSDSKFDLFKDIFVWLKPRSFLSRTGTSSGRPANERVHAGFDEAYRSVSDELRIWINDRPATRIIATGHSLGGALATLLAKDHPSLELVTFGSPRVGNASFASHFEGRTVRRYRDCGDFVTRVPFKWMGYQHVLGLQYIDHRGKIWGSADTESQITQDMRQGRRVFARLYRYQHVSVWCRDLADHAPINYVSALLGMRED